MKRSIAFACVAGSATLLLAAGSSEVAQTATEPLIVLDTNLLDSDWVVTGASNNGATEAHERLPTAGNPDAYRHMEHTNPPMANLSITHELVAQTYDPATRGAIGGIDYAVDRIELDRPFVGAAIGARFAVFQDGRRYLSNAGTARPFGLARHRHDAGIGEARSPHVRRL